MSTQVKRRRGTASDNASFTGALGEIVAITDTKRIAVHDEATAGGKTFLNATDIQNKVGTGDATVGGTGNAITLTHTFPRTAHTNGAEIQFKATADNSGAVTVAIDSIAGTKALEKMVNGTSTALSTGDIKNGVIYLARYDGTRYQLQTGGATAIVSVKRQVFTTSGTYTPSAGMVYAEVEIVGGGGSGFIASAPGAAYVKKLFTAAIIGVSQSVTIGARGTDSGSTGAGSPDGGAGGNTTFGALLTALGSAGGGTDNTVGGGLQAGAVASGGDVNIDGQPNAMRWVVSQGIRGGDSFMGRSGVENASTPQDATGYGAGGMGIAGGSRGGRGTQGICIITEYCSQ